MHTHFIHYNHCNVENLTKDYVPKINLPVREIPKPLPLYGTSPGLFSQEAQAVSSFLLRNSHPVLFFGDRHLHE